MATRRKGSQTQGFSSWTSAPCRRSRVCASASTPYATSAYGTPWRVSASPCSAATCAFGCTNPTAYRRFPLTKWRPAGLTLFANRLFTFVSEESNSSPASPDRDRTLLPDWWWGVMADVAGVTVTDAFGMSPLHFARQYGHAG